MPKQPNNYRVVSAIVILFCAVILMSCEKQTPPVKGFVLPTGDVENGKAVFQQLGCPTCHIVANAGIAQPADHRFQITLGGKTRRVKHYGDLLTSVINPDHEVSPAYRVNDEASDKSSSPMPDFTNAMTVAQMIDLVEFLHSSYEEFNQQYTGRYYYYGP